MSDEDTSSKNRPPQSQREELQRSAKQTEISILGQPIPASIQRLVERLREFENSKKNKPLSATKANGNLTNLDTPNVS